MRVSEFTMDPQVTMDPVEYQVMAPQVLQDLDDSGFFCRGLETSIYIELYMLIIFSYIWMYIISMIYPWYSHCLSLMLRSLLFPDYDIGYIHHGYDMPLIHSLWCPKRPRFRLMTRWLVAPSTGDDAAEAWQMLFMHCSLLSLHMFINVYHVYI